MTDAVRTIQPELAWIDGRFARGCRIELGADGCIAAVERDAAETTWPGRAVIPGLVNAHSHAFQRGLRGRGETFPQGSGSFWTWRQAMYELVERMDAPLIRELSGRAFREMLACGITTVGEFHYLHHDRSEAGYALDRIVLEAARQCGIRLVLLNAFYQTGGIGRELEGGQRRFRTTTVDEYWRQMDDLRAALEPSTQSLGVVAHSIRAVPPPVLEELWAEAGRRGMVLHMHVEEQRAEIEACRAAYGSTPMALINEHLDVGDAFCAVHCTHTESRDMQAFAARGGRVCLCPLTEANLGDGIPDVSGARRAGARICLGSDSNARIDPFEEMRWLEYVQRLSTESRGVCTDDRGRVGPTLLEAGTVHGAEALGLPAGRIAPGHLADLAVIDLDAAGLAGWDDDSLLDGLILGAGGGAVTATYVGGRRVYRRGAQEGPPPRTPSPARPAPPPP